MSTENNFLDKHWNESQNGDIWQYHCQYKHIFTQIAEEMERCFLEEETGAVSKVDRDCGIDTWRLVAVGLISLFALSGIIILFYPTKMRIKCVKVGSCYVVHVLVCYLGFLAWVMADFIVNQEKKLSKEKRPYDVMFFFLAIIKFSERIMINGVLLMVPKAGFIFISKESILHEAVGYGYVDVVDTLVNGWFSNYKRNTMLDKIIFTGLHGDVDPLLIRNFARPLRESQNVGSEGTCFGVTTLPSSDWRFDNTSTKSYVVRAHNGQVYKNGIKAKSIDKFHPGSVLRFDLDMDKGTCNMSINGKDSQKVCEGLTGVVYPCVTFYGTKGQKVSLKSFEVKC
eukprot:TRINITY_DN12946_c0_g5_i1.p1 TRINITY_DN12946_c0_g5~~TRINITY_DN12946_c0_g5_i1.p1  ORF type:complete len:340 (-),score=46.01 TRINITY_DN12946_c0_g5_i1:182-1201(-)